MLHLAVKAKADQKRERSEPRFRTGSEAIVQNLRPLSLDRQKVEILDISKTGLGILASNAVSPGTIVQVRINTAVELAEVRHCSASPENGFRIGLRFIAVPDESAEDFTVRDRANERGLQLPLKERSDRRQALRQELMHSAAVSIPGTDQVLRGEIRNVSEGGAQILLRQPLCVTSPVKIEYDGKLLHGEVVYCRQEQVGWLVGIRVGDGLSGAWNRSRL
jgi:hypothetical protein